MSELNETGFRLCAVPDCQRLAHSHMLGRRMQVSARSSSERAGERTNERTQMTSGQMLLLPLLLQQLDADYALASVDIGSQTPPLLARPELASCSASKAHANVRQRRRRRRLERSVSADLTHKPADWKRRRRRRRVFSATVARFDDIETSQQVQVVGCSSNSKVSATSRENNSTDVANATQATPSSSTTSRLCLCAFLLPARGESCEALPAAAAAASIHPPPSAHFQPSLKQKQPAVI